MQKKENDHPLEVEAVLRELLEILMINHVISQDTREYLLRDRRQDQ